MVKLISALGSVVTIAFWGWVIYASTTEPPVQQLPQRCHTIINMIDNSLLKSLLCVKDDTSEDK
jgi:hypothetical protein